MGYQNPSGRGLSGRKEEYEVGGKRHTQSYRGEGARHTRHSSLRDFLEGHGASHDLYKNPNSDGENEAGQMAQWVEHVPSGVWSLDPQNPRRAGAGAHICNPSIPTVRCGRQK